MLNFSQFLSIITAIVWTIICAMALPGIAKSRPIPKESGQDEGTIAWPRISVILSARNEEAAIEQTLQSLKEQNYPNYEVIAVNDRSEDATGVKMERLRSAWPELRVIHIKELPEGWVGKNHALWRATEIASGEWLLFTDGDIYFAPDALKRGMRYALSHQVDHLTVVPRFLAKRFWLHVLIAFFSLNFMLFLRPQNARYPRSKAFMGVGAFNFLKTGVYRAIGTHRRIALRPDDDFQLGKLIKSGGYAQHFTTARDFIEVEWYESLKSMMIGLEKNTISAFRYSVWMSIVGMVPLSFFYLAPYIAPFTTHGWVQGLYFYCLALMLIMFCLICRFTGFPLGFFIVQPVAVLLFAYTIIRSALLIWVRGGIYWRGTFYSLNDLKRETGG